MENVKANIVLDAKGLSCPMPIVKTNKAMTTLEPGHVLEVQATDKGSKADIKAWAESKGHQYIGTLEDGDVLKHFLRKASASDERAEKKHPHIITNEELEQRLKENSNIVLLDVREEVEFAFNHIPNAISLPLGDIENRMSELNNDDEIFVICRTGNRSDFAAQKLAENGFTNVKNVVPGMSQWTGKTSSINH